MDTRYTLKLKIMSAFIDVLRNRLPPHRDEDGVSNRRMRACTVIIEGQAVNSCLILAASAMGKSITTIEGLETEEGLHPIQKALVKHHAFQCGFCTPGFIMSAKAFFGQPSNAHARRHKNGVVRKPLPVYRI